MFGNVYDRTEMEKAVKERLRAYFQVGEARWSAGLPEAEDQMLWSPTRSALLFARKCGTGL
jgi:hypothetical protein